VWKLLRLRWVIFTSTFRRSSRRGKFGMVVLAILAAFGLGLAFYLSWLFLGFLRSPSLAEVVGDVTPFLESVPVLVVTAAFALIFITSFGVLLQTLYLAGDMEFLLSAPIPIRAVFVTKLVQAILPNFALILLFALPVLYGLGASEGYNLLYYPLTLIVLASLALAAAGIASLVVMGVVRIFPARRVAEIIGFLVAIVSFTCSQSGQLMRYSDLSGDQAMQAINMATRLDAVWSPLAWAGHSLVFLGNGSWLIGMALFLVTVVLAGGIFALSLVAAERLYYSGWASVQVSTRAKRPARAARRMDTRENPLNAFLRRLIPAPVRAIVIKDFLMLRRDLRNMSQLVTPLILGVVYAIMLIRRGGEPPAGRGEAPAEFMQALSNLMVYANVGISLFVGWSLLSRLAGMAFSQEGKNYWLLKSSPVSLNRLLTAKFLVAFLPTLALGWGFLVIISVLQGTGPWTLAYSMVAVMSIIAATAGLNLTFGVLGANFNWEDPRRISQGSAGCLGALASMVFLVTSLATFFGPGVLMSAFGGPEVAGQLAGLLVGAMYCLLVGFVPLWLVRGRVSRLAEE
jgi:ABC-2 type transport system permease protein